MPNAAKLPRIRLATVVERNDALLVGDRLFLLAEMSDFGWSAKWGCVSVKVRCHPDWVMTDATLADWETYVAGLEDVS